MPEAVIISIIGFLSAILGYGVAAQKNKADAKKSQADAGYVMGQAWRQLFDEMDERVKAQAEEISKLKQALVEKDCEIRSLQRELSQLQSALIDKNSLVSSYEARIIDLESEVETLRQQLDALGQKPRTRSKVAVQ